FSRLCFFSSRRRHTIFSRDWSSDVCSSDLTALGGKISFNFQTGAWSYQIAGDVDGDKIETFEYVIVDNDGDPSPATLTVHVEDKIGRASCRERVSASAGRVAVQRRQWVKAR